LAEFVIFGGTTEGRTLADRLSQCHRSVLVCVATQYGDALLSPGPCMGVHTGRLDAAGMEALLLREAPKAVIDATHPFALQVSQTIQDVCSLLGLRLISLRRETVSADGCLTFSGLEELLSWLDETDGVIFSTLGAKEAAALTAVRGAAERIWLRILPFEESLSLVRGAGFPAKHIICMQGPFSTELNAAMFRTAGASILLTKDSGPAGGLAEKLEAARQCGMTVALLARPEGGDGVSLKDLLCQIEEGLL